MSSAAVDIERLIKSLLGREMVEGFEPVHSLPESRLDRRPIKPSKPKKPRVDHRDGQRSGASAEGNKPRGRNNRTRAA